MNTDSNVARQRKAIGLLWIILSVMAEPAFVTVVASAFGIANLVAGFYANMVQAEEETRDARERYNAYKESSDGND